MSSLVLASFPAFPYTLEEVASPDASYSGRSHNLETIKESLVGLNKYFEVFCRERSAAELGKNLNLGVDLAQ
jgi:hypothetical protein